MKLLKNRFFVILVISALFLCSCKTSSDQNKSAVAFASPSAEVMTEKNVGEDISKLKNVSSNKSEHIDTSSEAFINFKNSISNRVQNSHSSSYISVTSDKNGIVINIEDQKFNEAVVKSAKAADSESDGPASVFSAWKTLLDSYSNLSANISRLGYEQLGTDCDCAIYIRNFYDKNLCLAFILNGTIQQDILETINPKGYSEAKINHNYKSSHSYKDNSTESNQNNGSKPEYNDHNNSTQSNPGGQASAALNIATRYIYYMPFSYSGLIKQLEYDGFSENDATYAAENCGANWKEQAALKAKRYLETMAFSKEGLIKQLEYDGFTESEAEYGVQQVSGSWNKQAKEKARAYLDMFDFSKQRLIDQLVYDGFTEEQATSAANAVMN